MVIAMKRSILAVILAAGLTPVWAQQQPQDGPADNGDATEHGVARLSIVQGNVSVRHGDGGDLTAGAVNAPLVETDRVVTGDSGRAEVQFDWANMIRLAPGTEVRLSQLQYKQYQVQIAAGTTTFRVLRQTDAQVEISTPTVSLRPTQPGSYRVTVQPDGLTEITVRDGEAEIFGPKGSEALHRGQTMMARGTPDDPEFQIAGPIPSDEWDCWNLDRDRPLQQQQTSSYRYVPPDVSGAESLDGYGQWQNDPQYGNVWIPNEGGDWAPYQDGRWSYIDYYGWSWVIGDPWGWAPYHYGNWYRSRWGWAWYPGAMGSRYYWHPAMVGFFGWGGGGFGGGFGFGGFGFGNVGWVPLAPFEVYHPWYGRGYGGRVNMVNNVNVTNVFRNARERNGVTGMRAGDFGRGAVNGNNRVQASSADLARAGAVRGAMPFNASAQSRQFTNATANTRGVPQTGANTRFYSNRGAGGNSGAGGGFARSAGGNSGAGPSPANSGGGNNGGWQRLNSSPGNNRAGGPVGNGGSNPGFAQNRGGGNPGAAPSNNGPANTGGGGWRRLDGNNPGGGSQGPRASGPQGGGANPRGSNPGYSSGPGNGSGAGPRGGTPQPGYRPQQQAPQGQGYNGGGSRGQAPQQPIRVNPPIVQNRGSSGGGGGESHPPSHAGGFGGGHSSGGGGGGGGGGSHGGGGGGGSHGGGHR